MDQDKDSLSQVQRYLVWAKEHFAKDCYFSQEHNDGMLNY